MERPRFVVAHKSQMRRLPNPVGAIDGDRPFMPPASGAIDGDRPFMPSCFEGSVPLCSLFPGTTDVSSVAWSAHGPSMERARRPFSQSKLRAQALTRTATFQVAALTGKAAILAARAAVERRPYHFYGSVGRLAPSTKHEALTRHSSMGSPWKRITKFSARLTTNGGR